MASTVLSRSVSSTGEIKKATFSVWLKKSKSTGEQFMFYSYENNNNNFRFRFNPEVIEAKTLQGGSTAMQVVTNRKFQDTSAWYHILLAMDSTQSTSSDRCKLYINGVQETSLSTATYPSQNANLSVNESGSTVYVGAQINSNYFDGYMTHLYYIDGTAYTPSTFGETDSTTGEWKIKTNPSLTYGTNGFSILKDGAGVTDLSGNPIFHGIHRANTFTYSLTGITSGNIDRLILSGETFTGITGGAGAPLPAISGAFLATHLDTATTLHFSTNRLITTGDHGEDSDEKTDNFTDGIGNITFTGTGTGANIVITNGAVGNNPNLHLVNEPGRFIAEFSIVSRE